MKISVCIPTFNQALYIKEAVMSAYNQSLPPDEIVVYNDASTDDTPIILQTLSTTIATLKVVTQPVNKGIAQNVDECLRAATGDLVVRVDSDDRLGPDFIKLLSAEMSKYPNAGYAHAAVQEIDKEGGYLAQRRLFRSVLCQPANDALQQAVKGYKVAANIIMFRRQALHKVNYLHGRPNFGEDFHLAASISAVGYDNIYLPQILSCYRVWVDIKNVRQKRKLAEIEGLRRVFNDVLRPAFIQRGWNTNVIDQQKEAFACIQADCLGWNIYNEHEKAELLEEIKKLSATKKVLFTCQVYQRGFGGYYNFFGNIKSLPGQLAKRLLVSLRPV